MRFWRKIACCINCCHVQHAKERKKRPLEGNEKVRLILSTFQDNYTATKTVESDSKSSLKLFYLLLLPLLFSWWNKSLFSLVPSPARAQVLHNRIEVMSGKWALLTKLCVWVCVKSMCSHCFTKTSSTASSRT